MKIKKVILAIALCHLCGLAFAGAKCRSSQGQLILTETVCPVGTIVEEYTSAGAAPTQWQDGIMPKLSINVKNTDIRITLFLLGDEMFPGRLHLDDSVSGTINLREFDIAADKLFFKILQMKSLEVMKIKGNYYVFPSAMGRNVAASMAALKGL